MVSMTEAPKGPHPKHGELYTPFTPEVMELLLRMRAELGSWYRVSEVSHTRVRALRVMYQGKRKAISYPVLDRLCSTTGIGGVHEFLWFTPDDLVALGIWKKHAVLDGEMIHYGGEVKKRSKKSRHSKAAKKEKERAKKRVLAKINKRRRRLGLPTIHKRYYGKYS
jgi:chromosome condensin MukBEF MukE localization factor